MSHSMSDSLASDNDNDNDNDEHGILGQLSCDAIVVNLGDPLATVTATLHIILMIILPAQLAHVIKPYARRELAGPSITIKHLLPLSRIQSLELFIAWTMASGERRCAYSCHS